MASRINFGRRATVWGSYEDSSTQTIASTTEAYPVELGTTVDGFGTAVVNNDSGNPTRLTVYRPGVYDIQFSLQLANSGGQLQDVDIWLSLNGINVDNTNTSITVPYSHAGLPGKAVAAWNFVLRLDSGDYVELYWHATSTDVSMPASAAQSNPTRPAIPSVILSIIQI